jgi:branched-chain amino acid transport system substrate-binding protein
MDLTGPAGFVGALEQDGANLAVRDINNQHFLGSTKLTMTYGDTTTSPTTGASLATAAVSANYPVVFYGPSSSVATAVAPILAKANQPSIFTQSGGPGVLLNKYMFRIPIAQPGIYPTLLKYLQSKGVKTVAVLQDSDYPTLVQMTGVLKTDAKKYGMTVKGVVSVLSTQSDISAAMTKLLSYHAQALAILTLSQDVTADTAARQGGFKGILTSCETDSSGDLAAGTAGATNGVTWVTDWAPGSKSADAVSKKFQSEYENVYHAVPTDFAAEQYDAVWLAARALKKANSVTHSAIAAAMNKIATAGFSGAEGQLVFKNGQESSVPVLAQWEHGKIVALS